MASLYIKDTETADLVSRVAKRSETTAFIRELVTASETELDRIDELTRSWDRLEKLWREHPLTPPTGPTAGKAFYDELSGDP